MPDNKFDDGLNEIDERVIGEAEADLQRLLSVEPSPEFAAKVRMKISAERREPRHWMAGWRFALAAASVVTAGIIVGLVTMRHGATNVPSPAPVVATAPPAPVQPVLPEPRTASREPQVGNLDSRTAIREKRTVKREPRTTDSGQRTAKDPEVLVPADQRVAMARLLAMARAGTLDERAFPAEVQKPAEGDTAPPIPPVVVEELKVPLIGIDGAGSEKGN